MSLNKHNNFIMYFNLEGIVFGWEKDAVNLLMFNCKCMNMCICFGFMICHLPT